MESCRPYTCVPAWPHTLLCRPTALPPTVDRPTATALEAARTAGRNDTRAARAGNTLGGCVGDVPLRKCVGWCVYMVVFG